MDLSTRSDTRCPHCRVVWHRSVSGDGRAARCLACRRVVRGGEHEVPRWLYPRIEGASSDDASLTGATLDPANAASMEHAPRVIDRYQLRGELGRGGMGVVYDAYDPTLGRQVALKVLLGGRFADAAAVQRFMIEARAAASLTHRGIVEVLELGMVDGQPYYTMRKVDGPSLADLVSAYGPVPDSEAVRIAVAVARAVAHAHEQGVVHRDLKPANVLLDDEPAVADFGLAKVLGEDGELTRSHAVLGTPGYVAPEVARAEPDIDWVRADVFGIGAILYAALTGRPPVGTADPARRLLASSQGDHTPIRHWRSDLPRDLEAVLHKAIHPEREQRYGTAAELADDLERWARGDAIHARPEPAWQRTRRWVRRHPVWTGGTLVAALFLGTVWVGPSLLDASRTAARESAARELWEVTEATMRADPARADLAFERFASTEQARGTAVLTRAWLDRGESMAPSPRGWMNTTPNDPRLSSYTTALVEAPDLSLRVESMWRIANWAANEGKRSMLDAVMQALAPHLDAVPMEHRLSLQLDHALHRGDVETATEVWEAGRAQDPPLFLGHADPRRLHGLYGRGTQTDYRVEFAVQTQMTHGGDPELVATHERTVYRIGLDPTLPLLEQAELPPRRRHGLRAIPPAPGLRGGFLSDHEAFTFAADGLRPLYSGRSITSAGIDLDGDGVAERFIGRQNRRFDRVQGTKTVRGHGWVDRAESDLEYLEVGDLDGDGDEEMVVGLGAWSAYDVRVLDVVDGGLEPRARAQRNAASTGTLVDDPWRTGRLIVTGEHDMYANVRVFGEEEPQGPPPAVVVRRLVGDTLETLWTWPLSRNSQVRRFGTHDLDRDGRQEIVAGVEDAEGSYTLVMWPGEEEGYEVSLLPRLLYAGAVEREDEPPLLLGLEGLVDERSIDGARALWMVGIGDETPPRSAPVSRMALGEPPSPAVANAWEVASLLSSAGLHREAAGALSRLASMSTDEVRDLAARGAADLWKQSGHPHRAALLLEQTDAVEETIRAHLASGEPEHALRVAGGRTIDAQLRSRLDRWAEARERRLELTGDVLHPAWTLHEPLAAQTGGDGLRLTFLRSGRSLAEFPLTWTGGPVAVHLDVIAERMDWAAAGPIMLDLGGTEVEMEVGLSGGGGVFFLNPGCRLDKAATRIFARPEPGAPKDVRFSFRLLWDPDEDAWTCAIRTEGYEGIAHWSGVAPDKNAPSSIRVSDHWKLPGPALRVRVERLELWGVGAGPADEQPLSVGRRRLAEHSPADALTVLPDDAWLDRAIAVGQQRRLLDTVQGLASAREEQPEAFEASLPFLIRGQRELFATPVREVLGEAFPGAYQRVWREALQSGGDTEEIEAALLRDLEGLSLNEDTRWLLARRAYTLLDRGFTERGRKEAEAWLAVGDGEEAARLRQALGALLCAEGDRAGAEEQARLAVSGSETPFIVRDRLRGDSDWEGCLPEDLGPR